MRGIYIDNYTRPLLIVSVYLPTKGCHDIQMNIKIVLISSGADPETLLTGQLIYGAIFSIIDGTNCSPKAVLVCRSVNLVFISFSAQSRKGTVIDVLKQSSGPSASTLSLIMCLPHILGFSTSMSSGSHILTLLSKQWWLNCSTFDLQSNEL